MNPILRKDVLQTLREKRVAGVQALFVVVLGVGVLACWPQQGVLAVADRAHDNLFDALILGQLVFLLLFVPGAAAVSLASEVEIQTFEMLYASRLTARQIVLGKILGAIAFPILLLLTGLPFVGLLALRGASSLQSLLMVYATLLLTAAFLSMIALAVSSFYQTTSGALVMSYLVMAGVCIAPLVPSAILLDRSSGWTAAGLHYARGLSPLAAVLAVLRPDWGDFDGRVHSLISLWPTFLGAATVAIIGCAALLAVRLSRPDWHGDRADTIGAPDQPLWRRLLLRKGSQAPRPPIAISNPLIINEGRINTVRSGRWCVRIFYGSVLTSMALALISLYGGGGDPGLLNHVTQVVIAFQIGVIALITPALTSASISSELETGTFELLRTTPLRPGQIFLGKLIPSLVPSLLPIVAFLPAYGTICYLDAGYIPYFLRLFPVLVLATIYCCTAGLLCSALFPQTARATVAGYIATAALFFVPLLAAWAASRALSERAASWIAMPSPMFVALNVVNLNPVKMPGIQIWPMHLIVCSLVVLALLFLARVRLAVLLKEG
jgi:ABC-type transport system involved in multi-copper enzyme maturation permease subunit